MAEHGKLSFEQACVIRDRYAKGETQTSLAIEYDVSQAALSSIIRMKTHKRKPLGIAERKANELLQKKIRRVMNKYGLTLDELQHMEYSTGNRCQICGKSPNEQKPHWRSGTHSLFVDHCHKTGKVRGLLCRNCNTAIGLMNDDPELMMKMIDYICHGGKTL